MLHLGDITKISGHTAPIVDVVVGGSPCQDLSIAGLRKGLDGERSGLFMEQLRIIKEMRDEDERNGRTGVDVRPRYMVWENVPGAFSSNKGEDFRVVLEETAKIKDKNAVIPRPKDGKWTTSGCIVGNGWSIAWRVCDAQFWGVPQRRRRISLVADFGGESAHEILFVRKSVSGNTDEGESKRKETPTNTTASVRADDCQSYTLKIRGGCEGGGKGALIQTEKSATLSTLQDQTLFQPMMFENHGQDTRFNGPVDISQTVSATFGMGGNNTPFVVQPKVIDVVMPVMVRKYPIDNALLCECLRTHKTDKKISNKEIAEQLDVPITKVEHWFRRDECFAIPDPEIWYQLKDLLGIETEEFDKAIMTFEERDGNYDMRNRIHMGETAPTLTCGSENNLYLIDQGGGKSACNITENISPTLTCTHGGEPVVCHKSPIPADDCIPNPNAGIGAIGEEVMPTLINGDNFGWQNGVCQAVDCRNCTESDINGALQSNMAHSLNGNNVVRCRYIVRRLTPLECERLQGYPDGWTDIGEWVDSNGKKRQTTDSVRYKALGNSIALPPWKWVLKRISACYERDATMASLFDGIGGFPYLWEQINGKGSCLWASEIEEFPIAVTKRRINNEI